MNADKFGRPLLAALFVAEEDFRPGKTVNSTFGNRILLRLAYNLQHESVLRFLPFQPPSCLVRFRAEFFRLSRSDSADGLE